MIDYDLAEVGEGKYEIEWHGRVTTVKMEISANGCDEWKKDKVKWYLDMLEKVEEDLRAWQEEDERKAKCTR